MANIYQFGNIYYHAHKRELVYAGEVINLRRKVAELLEMLLDNRHRVVEREELLTSIWREGVMRENSLLQCIRELRQALGDKAQRPQFIKTYHSKGYQWIYTPTLIISAEQTLSNESLTADIPIKSSPSKSPRFIDTMSSFNMSRGVIASIALVMCLMALFFYWRDPMQMPQAMTPPETITLAILPFSNNTGDASLQWVKMGLSDMVMSALAQSSRLSITPIYVVQDVLSKQENFDEPTQLLGTLNVDFLIQSQVKLSELSAYQFAYQVFDKNGFVSTEKLSIPDIIAAIPNIVTHMSHQLVPEDNDLANLLVLSTNRQANQDYANGMQALNTKGAPLAKRYFEAALLNDPNFLWAKGQLAQTLSLLGDWKAAKTQLQHLLQLHEVNGDPVLKSFVQLSLGNILLAQLQFNQAETLFQSVITLSDATKDRYSKVNALWSLSEVSEYRSQWDQQHRYAQQALTLTKNANDLRIQADSLYYLGSPSNSRLEFDTDIDMHENRVRLERALHYYQQLGDIPGQAKTWLSMGQNYTFDFEQRMDFLDQAVQWYGKLNDQMQLANTLAYQGFLYIQYHQGDKAVIPLQASFQISQTIGAAQAELLNRFLLAFAALDQGISRRGTEKSHHLQIATQLFIALRNDPRLLKNSQLLADTSLLLGWTLSEQNNHQQAVYYIKDAWQVYRELKMATSSAYSIMSLVKEYVDMQQWQQALQFINEPNPTKRTRQYFARSYYELQQYQQAVALAELNKSLNASQWSERDQAQLERYRQVSNTQQHSILPPEPSAHSTYCESLPESVLAEI